MSPLSALLIVHFLRCNLLRRKYPYLHFNVVFLFIYVTDRGGNNITCDPRAGNQSGKKIENKSTQFLLPSSEGGGRKIVGCFSRFTFFITSHYTIVLSVWSCQDIQISKLFLPIDKFLQILQFGNCKLNLFSFYVKCSVMFGVRDE